MTYTVRLREEAELDIADAAAWYEQQRERLGHDFLDEVLHNFGLLQENPLYYPIVLGSTHRAVLSKFPFTVFYQIIDYASVVVALMHGSRSPRSWKSRI